MAATCPNCGEAKRVTCSLVTGAGFYAYCKRCGNAWHHDTLKAEMQPPAPHVAGKAVKSGGR